MERGDNNSSQRVNWRWGRRGFRINNYRFFSRYLIISSPIFVLLCSLPFVAVGFKQTINSFFSSSLTILLECAKLNFSSLAIMLCVFGLVKQDNTLERCPLLITKLA